MMYKVIYKGSESWFEEPIAATEIFPAKGWEVKEFDEYLEAQEFIKGLNTESL